MDQGRKAKYMLWTYGYSLALIFVLISFDVYERLAAVGAAKELLAAAAAAKAAAQAAAPSSGAPAAGAYFLNFRPVVSTRLLAAVAWARWSPPAPPDAPVSAAPQPSRVVDSLDSRASQLCARLAALPRTPWPVALSSRYRAVASAASAVPSRVLSAAARARCWLASALDVLRDDAVRRAQENISNGNVETRNAVLREAVYAFAMVFFAMTNMWLLVDKVQQQADLIAAVARAGAAEAEAAAARADLAAAREQADDDDDDFDDDDDDDDMDEEEEDDDGLDGGGRVGDRFTGSQWPLPLEIPEELQQLAESEESCPRSFFCPITHSLMVQPAVAPSGISYDREPLLMWLNRGHATDPIAVRRCEANDIVPNLSLRTLISDWVDKKREQLKSKRCGKCGSFCSLPHAQRAFSMVSLEDAIVREERRQEQLEAEAEEEELRNFLRKQENREWEFRVLHRQLNGADEAAAAEAREALPFLF